MSVYLKDLSNNKTNYPTVTVELDYTAVCDIHNALCAYEKEYPYSKELALDFTNIFEMLKHGHLTDFGVYKNACYFRDTDTFENWESASSKEDNKNS